MLDCLLVHTPKFQNYYYALGNYTSLQLMSIGLFALADAVHQAGFKTRIIHLGLENALNPRFRIASYLRANPTKLVGLSCQFHAQLYDTLRAARAVKDHDPSIFVVIGGMAATCFAEEILAQHPAVDAVVRGEGEKPLVQLVRQISAAKRDFPSIPNLAWRNEGRIFFNAERYVATQEELDALSFHNFKLMEHYQHYVRMPKIFTRLKVPAALKWRISDFIARKRRLLYYGLPVGRGCDNNCAYCGGGNHAHRMIAARTSHVFRSQRKVLETMIGLKKLGYQGVYVSYDPRSKGEGYYPELFRLMRKQNFEFDMVFASWGIPNRDFLDDFAQTFDLRYSTIFITPERGSEETRRIARGRFFTNQELLDTLAYMEHKGIHASVFFSQGIPETNEQFEQTLNLARQIRTRFKMVSIDAFSIEIEPGAPWFLDPERFGITVTRKTLQDFIDNQKRADYSSMYSLGYFPRMHRGIRIDSEEQFTRLSQQDKCQFFCSQPRLCGAAKIVWKTVRSLGLSESGDAPI